MKPILLLTLVLCLTLPAPAGGGVPEAEERAVTSTSMETGTAWSIADPQNPTGALRNGEPITEENVLALLAEAKELWPGGMTWNYLEKAESGNNIYASDPDMSIGAACVTEWQLSGAEACGAFAAMLSDYVFGPSANPARRLEDNTRVRPGDIVFRVKPDGSAAHANIALSTAHYVGGLPCIQTADGNVGGKVRWFDTASSYPTRVNARPRYPGESVRVIFTRYPE